MTDGGQGALLQQEKLFARAEGYRHPRQYVLAGRTGGNDVMQKSGSQTSLDIPGERMSCTDRRGVYRMQSVQVLDNVVAGILHGAGTAQPLIGVVEADHHGVLPMAIQIGLYRDAWLVHG